MFEVSSISFLSYCTGWFGYNIVAHKRKFFIQHISSQELVQTLRSTPLQQSLLSLCFSISWKQFNLFTQKFLQTFLVLFGQSSIKKKKLHSLKTFARSYFGLFWGLIWMLFLYLLRTVKHFLINVFADVFSYYSSAFCTKQKFHSMSSSPASHLGIFCSVLRYFSLSWELFLCLFSYEIFHIYS